MKHGWLVVNGFLQSAKFDELYRYFLNSAQQLNISVSLVTSDSLVAADLDKITKPDFVLFWDKDTHLAHRLEQHGFRLFNSAHGVEVCDSKTLTCTNLQGVVPMPQTFYSPKTFPGVGYTNLNFVNDVAEQLGFPFVIKESYGSFGEQVYLAHNIDEAKNIIVNLAGKDFVMQQFVSQSFGKDVRVNVVGGKVVNAILRQGKNGDFRSNITLGGTMTQYVLSPKQIDVAQTACKYLGLDFAGVDLLFGPNGPLLCEINSNPHFKSTFVCTGVDLSKLILQYIISQIQ